MITYSNSCLNRVYAVINYHVMWLCNHITDFCFILKEYSGINCSAHTIPLIFCLSSNQPVSKNLVDSTKAAGTEQPLPAGTTHNTGKGGHNYPSVLSNSLQPPTHGKRKKSIQPPPDEPDVSLLQTLQEMWVEPVIRLWEVSLDSSVFTVSKCQGIN